MKFIHKISKRRAICVYLYDNRISQGVNFAIEVYSCAKNITYCINMCIIDFYHI